LIQIYKFIAVDITAITGRPITLTFASPKKQWWISEKALQVYLPELTGETLV
jgi:hypothetical protein